MNNISTRYRSSPTVHPGAEGTAPLQHQALRTVLEDRAAGGVTKMKSRQPIRAEEVSIYLHRQEGRGLKGQGPLRKVNGSHLVLK